MFLANRVNVEKCSIKHYTKHTKLNYLSLTEDLKVIKHIIFSFHKQNYTKKKKKKKLL